MGRIAPYSLIALFLSGCAVMGWRETIQLDVQDETDSGVEIQSAIDSWNDICSDMFIRADTGVPVRVHRGVSPIPEYAGWVANISQGPIDIWYDSAGAYSWGIYIVTAHELGHLAGLTHADAGVMMPTPDGPGPSEAERPELIRRGWSCGVY